MSWKEFKEMIYYTLLKRGQVLIAILGLIVAILVFMNAQKYGIGVNTISSNVLTNCATDTDCFEYCNGCVSVASTKQCEPNTSIICGCINNTCSQIT
jgi:hypothetical protein